jgi:hypothetical protein
MKITTRSKPLAVLLTAMLAAQAAFIVNTSQAQVTFQQVTNGLVDYYPLNSVIANSTPDLINRRDLTLVNMSAANIVAASHPGINSSNLAFYFSQSGGSTVAYYATAGQNPFDCSGDFLPVINQRRATMNFWVKYTDNQSGNELRLMGECANDGQSGPFFSISDKQNTTYPNVASYFYRLNYNVTTPSGVAGNQMSDGTWQTPAMAYYWNQGANDTSSNVCDGTWHMLTTEVETNGDLHVYVDGGYDTGHQNPGPYTDNEGVLAVAVPLYVTNTYYNTTNYPLNITNLQGVVNYLPAGTNSAAGNVRWMLPDINVAGAKTAFGGYIRNGSIAGGVAGQFSDIGFWNRTLSPAEIAFVMTNGLNGLKLNTSLLGINSFAAGFSEVGQGHIVNLSWNITGASTTPGSIVISGVGDVTALGDQGSTNVTLGTAGTYSFTLTATNGVSPNKQATLTVQTFQGVPSAWNLVQRFDGVFGNTTAGIGGNGWVTEGSYYNGTLDRFNVVTVNGNKALSPKSGYVPDAASNIGYDSPGALAWGNLNNLTMPPGEAATLFFRFSLTQPPPIINVNGTYNSGLDLGVGLTDFGFSTGPLGPNSGGTGTVGPGFRIVSSDSTGAYLQAPFDLIARTYDGPTSSYTNSYDYISDTVNGNANGLQTNVNYLCWLDVSNDNTMAVVSGGVTNTTGEPVFSLWLQAQGASTRTLLFSNFYGDRNYANNGQNNDNMIPYLNKVFASVSTESIVNGDDGAFFATNNMVLLDDFYLSGNGYNGTIPRLFNITSIVRASNGNVTLNWESLGSLFQTNTYSIQRATTLSPPNWTPIATGLASGGDNSSYTDTAAPSTGSVAYRITWP